LSTESRLFSEHQISRLSQAFHRGASESSAALERWLNAPTTMSIDSVDQCSLEDAISVLGNEDGAVCMSIMEMQGTLNGHMLLAFDDDSGLALSDLLLSRPRETAVEWGEMEISCVLETMNIAGSTYLNGIATDLSERGREAVELIPTPPLFLRDFAESLLETAFLDQAIIGGNVVFARARFDLSGQPLRWTFLLIPDPASLTHLSEILANLT
jgi:chemotaxis protein CheC